MSNVGDGVVLAAGPLLVASQTSSPFLVASAVALQRLPWLVLGLYAGAIADRVDRRGLVVLANLVRAAVLALLSATVLGGQVSIGLVLLAVAALGVAEVFVDTTTATLTPMLVPARHLGTANARLQAGFLLANQLVGPPLGAALFAAGMALPFLVHGVTVLAAAALVSRIATASARVREEAPKHVREDIREGLRWLWGHAPMRTLALVIFSFNITWAAAWAVLVLWSLDRVGMGELGFGLLTSAAAVGGLLGTASYGWLERRFPLATLMRACLLLEVLMHGVLAVTTVAWLALVVMFLFGAYAFVWHNVSVTIRQRAVPAALQGRVGSVYTMGVFGGMVLGQVVGGLIAERWGLAAPFWFAFLGAGLTLALVWRQLDRVVHDAGTGSVSRRRATDPEAEAEQRCT